MSKKKEPQKETKREFKWVDIKEWLVLRELQKLQERAHWNRYGL